MTTCVFCPEDRVLLVQFNIAVVLDNDGKSPGYGFVRFKDEQDQQ